MLKLASSFVLVRKKRGWVWYWLPVLHLLLALGFTWPLLPHFFSYIPLDLPDSYQNLWNFWWLRTALFEQHSNPYYTDLLFYLFQGKANPISLYLHTLQPVVSLPSGLLSTLFGSAAGYNLSILFGYVATGCATYALAQYFLEVPLTQQPFRSPIEFQAQGNYVSQVSGSENIFVSPQPSSLSSSRPIWGKSC